MIELVYFELKKIFSNKLIYIAAICIGFFILGYPIQRFQEIQTNFSGKEEVREIADKFLSEEYTAKELQNLRNEARNKLYKNQPLTKEDVFLVSYLSSMQKFDEENDLRSKMLLEIESNLKGLESNGKKNSFAYQSLMKEKQMVTKIQGGESFYLGDWYQLFDFNVAATMKIVLLILGLAGIFSNEYSNKVAYLNLSTKKGKTTLNHAKIVAAMCYACLVFLYISILYHMSGFPLGLESGSKPAFYLNGSIYQLSIREYYVLTLAISFLGVLVFTMIIVILSLITKNIIVSFGLPLFVYFLPDIILLPEKLSYIFDTINFTKLIKGIDIFGEFLVFPILGKMVIYPVLMLLFGILSILLLLFIYHKVGKRQVIN